MNYNDIVKLIKLLNFHINGLNHQLEFTGVEDYGDIDLCKVEEKMIELRDLLEKIKNGD